MVDYIAIVGLGFSIFILVLGIGLLKKNRHHVHHAVTKTIAQAERFSRTLETETQPILETKPETLKFTDFIAGVLRQEDDSA